MPVQPPSPGAEPAGRRALDRLVRDGSITREQHEVAINQARRLGEHCIDAVIDTGAMSESAVLRFLAGVYKTRFVSTEKLRNAGVEATVLRMVGKKVAEKFKVFPILFDGRTQTLSVVAPDLEEQGLDKQVQIASRAREVKVYVARPAAVSAAIRKHYDGLASAFDVIGARTKPPGPKRADGIDVGLGDEGFGGAMHDASAFDYGGQTFDLEGMDFGGFSPPSQPVQPGGKGAFPPPPTFFAPRSSPGPGAAQEAGGLPPPPQFTIDAPELAGSLAVAGASTPAPALDGISLDTFLETLTILVGLLEQGRGGLRGHSAHVARLSRQLAERLGLDDAHRKPILFAALLHDLGKTSTPYHLTALNVHQYEGHRMQAKKNVGTPVRLLEAAELPKETRRVLEHLYERWDGQGFPDRLEGKDVPLGSRIVAIAETYSDLTMHDKNPFRKALSPAEAWEAIGRQKGTFFDPNLVDLFRAVVLGEDLKAKLLADRARVLVVDPDPEETTVLELRFLERGYEVVVARDGEEGLAKAREGGFDLLITEVDLDQRSGFDLVRALGAPGERKVPVVFLTRRGERDAVHEGFELGAADYLVKPASADVIVAKVKQLLAGESRRGPRGVQGSLREMSLPDVIQILSNGRKSGRLSIESQGQRGELQFGDGAIHHASFGDREAHEAVYALLQLQDGEFTLDPGSAPGRRTIDESTETLLLEGMRRLDEAGR